MTPTPEPPWYERLGPEVLAAVLSVLGLVLFVVVFVVLLGAGPEGRFAADARAGGQALRGRPIRGMRQGRQSSARAPRCSVSRRFSR